MDFLSFFYLMGYMKCCYPICSCGVYFHLVKCLFTTLQIKVYVCCYLYIIFSMGVFLCAFVFVSYLSKAMDVISAISWLL